MADSRQNDMKISSKWIKYVSRSSGHFQQHSILNSVPKEMYYQGQSLMLGLLQYYYQPFL